MKIANWNVERPALRSPKNLLRIQHLLNTKADVVVLTETSTAVDLGPGYIGFHTEPSPRKPREGEAVAAIWVRESEFEIEGLVPTSDPREAICLSLKSDTGPLLIYASILPWHGYKGPDGTSPRWEEHKRYIEWHRQDWLRLRSEFPEHQLIAAGDYNQHRDGVGKYGNRDIRGQLTRALEDCDLSCVTEEDFVANGKLTRRNLDHICMTSKLADNVTKVEAWEGTIAGTRLSDNNGVMLTIDASGLTCI